MPVLLRLCVQYLLLTACFSRPAGLMCLGKRGSGMQRSCFESDPASRVSLCMCGAGFLKDKFARQEEKEESETV